MQNAVIVYLTQPKRIEQMVRSLSLLQRNFLDKFPYPVVVFHEGDIVDDYVDRMRIACPTVRFRTVSLEVPPWIDRPSTAWEWWPGFSTGYRSMCRFFAITLPDQIRGYDWYMRLDDDSFITSPIREDPFEYLADNGKLYGWRIMQPENPRVVRGLTDLCMRANPSFATFKWDGQSFFNNFHIAKIDLWERPPIRRILVAIDRCGGIYTRRWGDHTIQTLVVKAYASDAHHQFTDFDYSHADKSWPAEANDGI